MYQYISEIILKLGEAKPELSNNIEETRNKLLIFLSIFQVGYTILVFVVSIFISHKIAGPIYKLVKYMKGIRNGENLGQLFFRKGDYFPELAEEFNETFEKINENYKNDFVYISEVNAYLKNLSLVLPDDKKVVLTEINKKLLEIQNRFNNV